MYGSFFLGYVQIGTSGVRKTFYSGRIAAMEFYGSVYCVHDYMVDIHLDSLSIPWA